MNATVFAMTLIIGSAFAVTAWLAIWSRRQTAMRHVAVAVFLIGIPAIVYANVEILGYARPLWTMWGLGGDFRVLGGKMVEDEAIYLLLDVPDDEPRAVRLPWDRRQAEALQDIFSDPQNQNQAIMKYEWSWDNHPPQFHPLPQPPILPDKPVENQNTPHFEL